jgi:hypothetical protein
VISRKEVHSGDALSAPSGYLREIEHGLRVWERTGIDIAMVCAGLSDKSQGHGFLIRWRQQAGRVSATGPIRRMGLAGEGWAQVQANLLAHRGVLGPCRPRDRLAL